MLIDSRIFQTSHDSHVDTETRYLRKKWNGLYSSSTIFILNAHKIEWLATRSDNKVRELIPVDLLHTSLLNITVIAFKVLPLGSYASMPAPNQPFETILELIL
jgi:hypothetical protein